MESPLKNKELPPAIQFTALCVLWFVWLSAVAIAVLKDWKMRDEGRYYDYPFIVYQLLFVAVPLVLVLAGIVFLGRMRPITQLGSIHRLLYYVIGGLTFVTAIVLLSCGVWALSLGWGVIRE